MLTTITTTTQTTIRRLVLTVVALAIFMGASVAMSNPAEAAERYTEPRATCSNVNGAFGRITVHSGLQVSGNRAENVGIGYVVQRWNGSTWENYLSNSYIATVYPYGQTQFPPVHTVQSGYYRVYLALAWYENGSLQNWEGWVPIYNQAWGSYYSSYCYA